MVKAIQVGLGHWGFSWTKDVLPKVEAVEPVAYVDASPAALERVQAELGVPEAMCFASLDEAAAAVEADLVIATLRTEAHYPVCRKALELGFHVIVEKPFASTMAEAKTLVQLAQQADRFLMVSQNYRHNPAPVAVADLVERQALGSVNLVSIDFRRHAPTQGYRYWDFPDPLLADMSIHHFDLMRMVLGDEPKRVSCRTWNPKQSPFVHHPVGVATLEFEHGTIVSYRGSWISGGPATPWAGEWSMDCTDGEIWWTSRDHHEDGPKPDVLKLKPIAGATEEPELPALAHTDRAGALAAVAEAIRSGEMPPHFSSGQDNLGSLALVRATIVSASRDGEWIEIAELMQ